MNNRILVKLYVPTLEIKYDVWIPANKTVYYVISMMAKAINEISGGNYRPTEIPTLYNKDLIIPYNINQKIRETDIRNGTELVLI